jgi:myosin-3
MEAKVKLILNTAQSRSEAQRLLQKEKFRDEDIVRILQKFYKNSKENFHYPTPSENISRSNTPSSQSSPSRKAMTPKDQHLELVGFAQNLHLLNQEVHKNLRMNKSGIPIKSIDRLPVDYKRPPGFSLVPGLLGNMPGNDYHILNLIKANGKSNHMFNQYNEASRFVNFIF